MSEPTPNRPPTRVRTPWWFRLIRISLNLALLALLGVQVFAFIILSTDKHLQLPAFARRALENNLREHGIRVHFSNLEVSPSGTLFVHDPQVFLTDSADPVMEAEYVIVEPDWFTLLWNHQLSLTEIRFGNATLYCPPENSPNGEREPFLSEFSASVASGGNHWWRLDYIRGRFFNLQFSAQGNVVLPATMLEGAGPSIAPAPTPNVPVAVSLAAQYRRWSRQLLEAKPQFAWVDNPLLEIEIKGENSGMNMLHMAAHAANAHPPVPGLELSNTWVHLDMGWNGNTLRTFSPVLFQAQKVRYTAGDAAIGKQDWVTSNAVWAKLQLAEGRPASFSEKPSRVAFFALNTTVAGFLLDSAEVDLDLRSWPGLPFTAAVRQGSDVLKISGHTNFSEHEGTWAWQGGNLAATARLRMDTLLSAFSTQPPKQLATLKFDTPLDLTGKANITPEGELQTADLKVRTDGTHFEHIDLDAWYAHAQLSRDELGGLVLEVNHAELKNRSWQVDASYYQNLRTNDFRILAHGDLDPHVLDPFLLDWWKELWTIITPGGQWPQADVAYIGNWKQPAALDSINVYAQIANARVRGVRTNNIHVRVEQRPEILSVFDIVGDAAGGGEIHGEMFWTMKPPYAHIYEERMVFDSTLPLAALGAVGGKDAADAVRPLESTTSPTVRYEQRTGGLGNPQPGATASLVHAEFSGPLHAYHIPLDRAVVDTKVYKGFTDVPHFEFGIAGGQAQGNATITSHTDRADELRFKILLENARHTDFLSALSQFRLSDENPSVETPPAKSQNSLLGDSTKPGLLDLALSGQMLLGEPDSFVALGGPLKS